MSRRRAQIGRLKRVHQILTLPVSEQLLCLKLVLRILPHDAQLLEQHTHEYAGCGDGKCSLPPVACHPSLGTATQEGEEGEGKRREQQRDRGNWGMR